MHINDYLRTLNCNNNQIGYTYYDMDVNNDYIINEKDLALAQDNNLKNAIYSLIEDVDKDSELVFNVDKDYRLTLKEEKKCNTKGLTKEDIFGPDMTALISARDGMASTNEENFENDVLNSKGVTFVVMGNLGTCSYCNELERALVNFKDELGNVAKIYNMGWDSNREFCRAICKQDGIQGSIGFPKIAKFIDGKFDCIVDTNASEYSYQTFEDGKQRSVTYGENPNNYYGTRPDIIDKLINVAKAPPKDKDMTLLTDDNGLYVTNTANFNKNVEQSKGTTYVVMGSLGIHGAQGTCYHCNTLYSAISSAQEQLKGVANVFHMAWDNNLDADLCRKICYEMGNVAKPATFPQIAKFVDGKFVEMLSNTRDVQATIQEMLAKAEGTPELVHTNKQKTENAEENVSTEDKNTENIANTEQEQKLAKLKNQIKQKEIEAKFLQNIVEQKESEIEKIREELADTENSNTWFKNIELSNLESSLNLSQTMANNVQNELFFLNNQYLNALNQ
ncbi:hypothetical protein J6Q66_06265 [bacterium]|nr:hypothetical protein [bacterium]